jgi:hypothetical protein
VPPAPLSDEICTRLERMKKLCEELDRAQDDRRRCKELIERIRLEATAFQRTLGTHDPKPETE